MDDFCVLGNNENVASVLSPYVFLICNQHSVSPGRSQEFTILAFKKHSISLNQRNL